MKPAKIQSSGYGLTLRILLLFTISFHSDISAQTCSGTLGSVKYDTVVTGTSAAAFVTLAVPKLDPATKTLYAVVAQTSFTIDEGATGSVVMVDTTNTDMPAPQVEYDGYAQWVPTNIGSHSFFSKTQDPLLDPVTHLPYVVTGPALQAHRAENVPFHETNLIPFEYDSVTTVPDLLDFVGTDTANVAYFVATNAEAVTPGVLNQTTNNVTAHFSFTLYYCNVVTLSSDLQSFTAQNGGGTTVLLNWSMPDERPDRKYEVQVSADGQSFEPYITQTAWINGQTANYWQLYHEPVTAKGKRYFRLKEIGPSAPDRYSAIREVDLGDAGRLPGIQVYPDPVADYLQLALPAARSAWQVDIFHSDGVRIQTGNYLPASAIRIDFRTKMAPGIYFIRATDLTGNRTYSTSFIIK